MMMKSFQTLVLVWGWSNQEGLEGQRRGLDPIGNTGLPIQGGGGDAGLPVEDGGEDLPKGGELECGEGQLRCADDSKCLPGSWQDSPIVIIFRDYPIYCLPQNCLLVGNPEVGNSDTINHQDCLP